MRACACGVQIGTDIQDNKCGWLVVQALDVATPAQRLLLEENYARDDDACVEKVKALYSELKLKEVSPLAVPHSTSMVPHIAALVYRNSTLWRPSRSRS